MGFMIDGNNVKIPAHYHGCIVGVSLAFGIAVVAMVYAVGDISGAHINPAVSLGFFVANRMSGNRALAYVMSQMLGALTGSLCLRWLLPFHETYGATLPTWALALAVLEQAHRLHPRDGDLLSALAMFNRDRGATDIAIGWAQLLVARDPNDANATALLRSLRQGK